MIDDIKEAINKNLSAEVGKRLQERLAEGEAAIKRVAELKNENTEFRNRIHDLQAKEGEWKEVLLREKNLSREKQEFEIEKREWKIEMLNSKYNDVRSLMSDVFRNQRIVWRKTENNDRHWTDHNGYSHYDNNTTTTDNEKVEE